MTYLQYKRVVLWSAATELTALSFVTKGITYFCGIYTRYCQYLFSEGSLVYFWSLGVAQGCSGIKSPCSYRNLVLNYNFTQ